MSSQTNTGPKGSKKKELKNEKVRLHNDRFTNDGNNLSS